MGVTLAETTDGWRSGPAEQLRVKSGGASGARECLANPATGLEERATTRNTEREEEERLLFLMQSSVLFLAVSFFSSTNV